ncbi:hypothetical protein [Streptomyces spiralis]
MNVVPDNPWAAAGMDAISGRVLEHLVDTAFVDGLRRQLAINRLGNVDER